MRRGLSELIGAIIISMIIASSTFLILYINNNLNEAVGRSSLEASKRIIAATQPIYMSLSLVNSTLIMDVYVFSPIKISSVIYINNNSIKYIKIDKNVYDYYRVIVDPNYDCKPSRIYLVLEDGPIIPYSPQRDPKVLILPEEKRAKLYTRSFIDCNYLEELNNLNNENKTKNSQTAYLYNETFKIIEAEPAHYSLARGNPYSIKYFNIKIKGNLTTSGRVLFKLYSGDGKQQLASNTIKLPSTGGSISGFLYRFRDDGFVIDIYSRVSCVSAGPVCIVGLSFKLHNATGLHPLFSGSASLHLTVNSHYSYNNCDYNDSIYIIPAVYAPISAFKSRVNGTCREIYGRLVNFTGDSNGQFVTPRSVALLISTSPSESFELNGDIYFKEVMILNASKTSTTLTLNNSIINYKRISIKPKYANPLTKAVVLFNYDSGYNQSIKGSTYYKIKINNTIIYKPILEKYLIFPINGEKNLTVFYDPPHQIPIMTLITINYSKTKTGLSGQYYYEFNATSEDKPLGYPSLLPGLVIVRDLSHGINYLLVFPIDSNFIYQLNKKYYGLSIIIGGLPVKTSSSNPIYYEPIQLTNLQNAAIYIKSDIYGENIRTFSYGSWSSNITGPYLFFIKIKIDKINLYKVIISFIY